ncbi:MAG: hypothetical protein GY738_21045, partial [Pseudoalteromonas sp.]|nr:hypothetical protein [Pseudoalteromonas sp.]
KPFLPIREKIKAEATGSSRPIKCFNCGKEGHLRRDCKAPLKDATTKVGKVATTDKLASACQASLSDGAEYDDQLTSDSRDDDDGQTSQSDSEHGNTTDETEVRHITAEVKCVTPKPNNLVGPTLTAPITIEGVKCGGILDFGSSVNIINAETARKIAATKTDPQKEWWGRKEKFTSNLNLTDYNGGKIHAEYYIPMQVTMGAQTAVVPFIIHPAGRDQVLIGTSLFSIFGGLVYMPTSKLVWSTMYDRIVQPAIEPEHKKTDDPAGKVSAKIPQDL